MQEHTSMDKIALASLNSFASNGMQADFESPAESITVPASLLQDLLGALQDLKEEVAQLREERDQDRQEIAVLRTRLASMESLQESEISRVCVDIAQDRKRLASLEHPIKEPGKTVASRAEKIEKYLSSRPDHRATFETLKGHLGIDNDLLGIAIRSLLPSGKYAVIKTPGDKRKRTLVLLPR